MNAMWLGLCLAACAAAQPKAELAGLDKVWDKAPHNAFTDLARYKGRWYLSFREGQAHVSPDGAIRLLTSGDGERWTPAARIRMDRADLRDPKLSVTPEERLLLTSAGALHPPSEFRHQTFAWVSNDGREWGEPFKIGEPDFWLWRVVWHRGYAYSPAYRTTGSRFIRLYVSQNGVAFRTHAEDIFDSGSPSEAALLFLEDETGLCLLRRDGDAPSAQLGVSRPPYRAWSWRDLGVRIGGQQMLRLPDDRIVVCGRFYDPQPHTSLAWLDLADHRLLEFLKLPSGGDTSYPGLVFHDGLLWVSYYSSHEGKASIYLAKVKLPPLRGGRARP